MFSNIKKVILLLILVFGFSAYSGDSAYANTKVMWGKTELKLGQIGKVTILQDTPLVKINANGSLSTVRTLKMGDEFRVYSYKSQQGGLYGVGGGSFVQLNKTKVKYETPSKSKLAQLALIKEVQQVVDLTNAERTKAGLKPLQIDTKLTKSAQAKSQDMKNKNYFSHTSPTYGSPFDQMKAFGVTYKSAAENIARGQHNASEVVKAWMESPGHRTNIMNRSYTHIGVGLSDSGYYWTQQFIQ